MKTTIPIMHCFDDRYALPAAVAFSSLLEHASREYGYKLYVLHSDISEANQAVLHESIEPYAAHGSLEFIDMRDRFSDIWDRTVTKGHYAKEMFYKLVAASVFPQYQKVLVADVDVVYLGDVSPSYFSLDPAEDAYLAGVRTVTLPDVYLEAYRKDFTPSEIAKLQIGGGFLVLNLEKLRRDRMEEVFLQYFSDNCNRLRQAEQDVLNLCSWPKIKYLPLRFMACSYLWDLFSTPGSLDRDGSYTSTELRSAMEHPVQLHYATHVKPWTHPACTQGEAWWRALAKTPALGAALNGLDRTLAKARARKAVTLRVRVSRKKAVYVEIGREKISGI